MDLFPIILVSLLVLHVAFVVWLLRTKRLEKWDISLLLGVIVMQRTQRGKRLIDAIARPRLFWNLVGDAGIVLTLVGMVAMTAVFLAMAPRSLAPDSGLPALGLREFLVIPGINPFVPLWYGIIALAITLIVHEGGHGILARANGMKLKSLGLLWLVVPVGAFVEPEELDLKVARRWQRLRVFGAGPAVNIAVAALALVAMAGLAGGLVPKEGAWVEAVSADPLGNDLPAKAAGMEGGDIIVRADGEPIPDNPALAAFLNRSRPGQTVAFTLVSGEMAHVRLTSVWSVLPPSAQHNVTAATDEGQALCRRYFGEGGPTGAECASALERRSLMGIRFGLPESYAFMSDPWKLRNFAILSQLPLQEVLAQQPVLSVYLPTFYETPFHSGTFWVLLNLAFWIFWINLMVGFTNILPMLPLDGGHIFREAVGGIVAKVRPSLPAERQERLVGASATAMSLLILGALLVSLVGPWLARA